MFYIVANKNFKNIIIFVHKNVTIYKKEFNIMRFLLSF